MAKKRWVSSDGKWSVNSKGQVIHARGKLKGRFASFKKRRITKKRLAEVKAEFASSAKVELSKSRWVEGGGGDDLPGRADSGPPITDTKRGYSVRRGKRTAETDKYRVTIMLSAERVFARSLPKTVMQAFARARRAFGACYFEVYPGKATRDSYRGKVKELPRVWITHGIATISGGSDAGMVFLDRCHLTIEEVQEETESKFIGASVTLIGDLEFGRI